MSLDDFLDRCDRDVRFFQSFCGALGCQNCVTHFVKLSSDIDSTIFVSGAKAEEHAAGFGKRDAGGKLAFGERDWEPFGDPHDFAGGSHFGSKYDVDPHELSKRKHTFFNRVQLRFWFFQPIKLRQLFTRHHFGSHIRNRDAGSFGDKRNSSASTRVYFENVNVDLVVFFLDGKLNIHEPDYF